jgi:hypothetical protein
VLHIEVDHDRYNRDRWYRRLVTCWICAAIHRADVVKVHFVCRDGCCENIFGTTVDWLLRQVRLDDPRVVLQVFDQVKVRAA